LAARAATTRLRRFRTLAEMRWRGEVPRIANLRRDEHTVRDVPETEVNNAVPESSTGASYPTRDGGSARIADCLISVGVAA
jgi:hypothetical protein